MDVTTQNRINAWLEEPFDQETRKEVLALQESDPKTLEDCFYTDLAFGTGGMRGLIGVGTNRINRYTTRKAANGLAKYLKKQFLKGPISVVIGFDNRTNSEKLAKEASSTLIQNGIDVFLFEELRPTPLISFACRTLNAKAAIMITASHNPKEYNGLKVYWDDGAQVVFPHDEGIMKEVQAVRDFSCEASENVGTLHLIGKEMDDLYLQTINQHQSQKTLSQALGSTLKIVYTSLHGTGITLMPNALKQWNFSNLAFVREQIVIDGNFPTAPSPNPESPKALQLGLDALVETSSDLLLATDPDADRLGIAILHENKPVIFTGNEIACLCVEYLCEVKNLNQLVHPFVITTIVSSDLIRAICKAHEVQCLSVLTGFKYIAERIRILEKKHPLSHFLFGAEESYGYLYAKHSRDKDAIITGCLIAEMTLYYKEQKKTLLDVLHSIYAKYGIFQDGVASLEFSPGKEGILQLQQIMNHFRKNPPIAICDIPVAGFIDYEKETDLPKSDVLLFRLADGSKLILRPSGTEPKLKIYAGVHQDSYTTLTEGITLSQKKLQTLLQAVKTSCHLPLLP
jgi:phosphomannomutase